MSFRYSLKTKTIDLIIKDYLCVLCFSSFFLILGNDALYALTMSGTNEVLILLETWSGVWKHARYANFGVNGESDKYRLTCSGYSGTAGKLVILSHLIVKWCCYSGILEFVRIYSETAISKHLIRQVSHCPKF